MNILLTGGAGFIGSHVAEACLDAGHRVVVVDNLSTGNRDRVPKEAVFYELDITRDDLGPVFRDEKIDVVNHHAAQVSVQDSFRDPIFDAKSNIFGTLQLIKNALSYQVARIIFASTGGALYGEMEGTPANESAIPDPKSPYAISKLTGEHYLDVLSHSHALEPVVLRYANVYGPGQNPLGEAGVVAIHCHRLCAGNAPIIFGDGEQTRDFISVRDVVSANLKALEPGVSGTFNVGTGIETSINTLTGMLVRLSGLQVDIDHQPAKPGELFRSAVDAARLRKTGWEPVQNLENGLLETYDYFYRQARH